MLRKPTVRVAVSAEMVAYSKSSVMLCVGEGGKDDKERLLVTRPCGRLLFDSASEVMVIDIFFFTCLFVLNFIVGGGF